MSQVQWDADAYQSVASPQLEWGRRLIDSREWRGDEVVLDAGCGPGTLAVELLARLPRGRVVAIDNDAAMVRRAADNLSRFGSRATVLQQDLAHLSIDETFDVIFSNAVLHWVPDHDAAFTTFLKHLKPGGELLLQCGGESNLERIRGLARQTQQAPAFASYFEGWSPPWHYEDDASTQERLLIAGFVHPKVTLEDAPTVFPDKASFRRFVQTVVLLPYFQRIPMSQERTAFLDDFVARVTKDGHGLNLDYVRLNVRAQRSPHH